MSPGELTHAKQLAYDALREQGLSASDLLGAGPLSVGQLETVNSPAATAQLAPGTLKAPPQSFDRASAEAAAYRYMEIQSGKLKAPKDFEAREIPTPRHTVLSSTLFGRASDVYRQFPSGNSVR